MSFFQELKRRNVFRVGAAYAVISWVLLQIGETLAPALNLPDWVNSTLAFFLILGFPLALFFAWAFELTPEGIKKEKDVDRSTSITHVTGRKLDYTVIALLALGLAYFIWESRFSDHNSTAPTTDNAISAPDTVIPAPDTVIPANAGIQTQSNETATLKDISSPVATPPQKSIAVLPFVNMSDDTSNEYFSDGISEEILNALAKVKELKVAGRTSSFSFKGENEDLRQIGEMLGVSHILEGSVRKSGNRVRITAQLIKVDDGFHLWSDSYDRELDDVFAIQDEISAAILVQLKTHLIGEETPVVARTNTEAYELYLLAKQRMYERNRLTIESAMALLDQAIAIDPEYAPAYALRGIASLLLSDEGYGNIPNADAEAQGKAFLEKALALDANQPEALAGMGLYHAYRVGEHKPAIELLTKALAINPNLIDASNWLQVALASDGDHLGSLQILEQMIERDPLYTPGIGNVMFSYFDFGMQAKAQALVERVRPFMPGDPQVLQWQSILLSNEGHVAAALAPIELASAQRPEDWVMRAVLGDSLIDLHEYDRVAEMGQPRQRVYALDKIGRKEEARLLALEEVNDGVIAPYFDLLTSNGRFEELLDFVEAKWPNLEAMEQDYAASSRGHELMLDVALAYAKSQQQGKFHDALNRVRMAHDKLKTMGINSFIFSVNEASYYALAGDQATALSMLEKAVDAGYIGSLRLLDDFPEFEPMQGEPRYETIQAKMIDHLNQERSTLGLEPVTV